MMLVAAALLVIGALIFTLLVRTQDLPEPEPVSPVKHLEERKATIYDNLRDLQFEYRVGKLSEEDYQQTKKPPEGTGRCARGNRCGSGDGAARARRVAHPIRRAASGRTAHRTAAADERSQQRTTTVRERCALPALRREVRQRDEILRQLRQAPASGGLKMKRAIALLTAATAFAAVDGTVVNQTTGKPQPNAVVTLFKLAQSGPQYVQAAKSDAQGKFTIEQETGPGPLLVETGFQGVSYNQMLPPGMPRTGVMLSVFDSTKDPAAAQIEQHILILEPTAQQLGVTESYFFRNDGKVTYDDPVNGTLRFFAAKAGSGTVRVMATSPGSMAVQRQPESRQSSGCLQAGFSDQAGRRNAHRHQLCLARGGNLLEEGVQQRHAYAPRGS